MADDLAAITNRIRQRRAATGAAAAAGLNAGAGTLRLGDEVFDSLSGLDGSVLGVGLADRLRVNDVRVRLDDGRDVIRSAGELLARPTLG